MFVLLREMTCEALAIGIIAGLVLIAGVLSFQMLADRKAAQKEVRRQLSKVSLTKSKTMVFLFFLKL